MHAQRESGGGGNNNSNSVNKFLLLVYLNEWPQRYLIPTAFCWLRVRTSSGRDSPGNTPIMFLRAKERAVPMGERQPCRDGSPVSDRALLLPCDTAEKSRNPPWIIRVYKHADYNIV